MLLGQERYWLDFWSDLNIESANPGFLVEYL